MPERFALGPRLPAPVPRCRAACGQVGTRYGSRQPGQQTLKNFQIQLGVEVAAVRHDGPVAHRGEVLAAEHVDVAGRGDLDDVGAFLVAGAHGLASFVDRVDHAVFRVTRDADFTVDDEADDLLRAVEDELRRRRFGEVVRLEVSSTQTDGMSATWTFSEDIEQNVAISRFVVTNSVTGSNNIASATVLNRVVTINPDTGAAAPGNPRHGGPTSCSPRAVTRRSSRGGGSRRAARCRRNGRRRSPHAASSSSIIPPPGVTTPMCR